MASGDDIEAGRVTGAESTTDLIAQVQGQDDKRFFGDVIFRVGPHSNPVLRPLTRYDGIMGIANTSVSGITPTSGTGVIGLGSPRGGTGVRGQGGVHITGRQKTSGGIGVHGIGGNGDLEPPFAPDPAGTGVVGQGGAAGGGIPGAGGGGPAGAGVVGVAGGVAIPAFAATAATGVHGEGGPVGVGVRGHSTVDDGVVGLSDVNAKSGVFGFNSSPSGVAFGIFGRCDSISGAGVSGRNLRGDGVSGFSDSTVGVAGRSGGTLGIGVSGAANFVGVTGSTPNPSGYAGAFLGQVFITGALTVGGAKSAAVAHADGSYRRLYSMESPESWFEDFGEGSLVDGKAVIQLEPVFADLVQNEHYHVFLTPYGDSNGLFVSYRCSTHFDVQEQKDGKSNLMFSYRIIAKRGDIAGERLALVEVPQVPEPSMMTEPPDQYPCDEGEHKSPKET